MRKTQEIETIVCDICGEVADGSYNSVTCCNDRVFSEMSCPHDLCEEHMMDWVRLCEYQAREYYEGEKEIARQLEEFKSELKEATK